MLPLSGVVTRRGNAWLGIALLLAAASSCAEAESGPAPGRAAPETAWVEIGDELFELELALDPSRRQLGLGRRSGVARDGGMLFVFPDEKLRSFVMRDCAVPLDLAYLDGSGRIVAIHEMQPEPPRRRGESPSAYERRLPGYPSRAAARFAIETAGGRLAEVGAEVGQRVIFDAETLARRAR